MDDASERRYAFINLPHARTIVDRIERTVQALGGFGEGANGGAIALRNALGELERAVAPFDEDPPIAEALRAADALAEAGRALVESLQTAQVASDRLGQHVRNFFECLGLAEEGASLSLRCGERPDSPLR